MESNRTDTLGISETINPTKKMLLNKIFIIIYIAYKVFFIKNMIIIIKNIADISNKLIL